MIKPTLVVAFLALFATASIAQDNIPATLFKNAGCKCCDHYADYLKANGFSVTVIELPNMSAIKRKYSVREDLEGCHSTIIGDYVVEGHVPVGSIKRLLSEKPAIKGISLPGMPEGSPGMSGEKAAPFEILSITGDDKPAPVYATE
ncbi:MAG: DUF411 domain-containing protein [Hyphomicrobium sp.]|uniref:DUF411 domain-containing protein n=1 Tax=Hyphomicrobium sp. TaxID=82 RepID=UPI0025C68442|nr:DUF411 domain-containing protein [Hyphomicrobium sp.]MBX9865120.1 DUF411 domain-containing protein [Hyphomicrobium sp.]